MSSYKVYTRPLNVEKLINYKFMRTTNNLSNKQVVKHYELPLKSSDVNFIKLEEEYLEDAFEVYLEHVTKCNFYQILTLDLFRHTYLDNPFMESYIVLGQKGVEFASYFKFKSQSNKHKITKAYITMCTYTVETPYKIIKNLILMAHQNGVDIINIPITVEYDSIIYDLQFEDEIYENSTYLYNFKIKPLTNKQIGSVCI